MKPPKLKLKSAVTGQYTKAKGADPAKTYQSDDYPARMLRKLVRLVDKPQTDGEFIEAVFDIAANIKKRMGWDKPKPRKVK